MNKNKDIFESSNVVHYYSVVEQLQKPEVTILDILKDKLKNMKMLDIGVGGGRTTIHFAKLVKEYVGIDYSINMIDACKKRFCKKENVFFKVSDVRALEEFKDNSFDFILCSFNGLDYINHNDRIKAFNEIKRVLKRGGIYVFSAHNLNSLTKFYFKYFNNPIELIRRFVSRSIVSLLSGSIKEMKKMRWVIVKDGAYRCRAKTYYTTPLYQVQQLRELNFKNIHIYSLDNGKEIDILQLNRASDLWVYYMCNV